MSQPISTHEVLLILVPVNDVLDRRGVAYRDGGSVASSYHGQQRATQDVDLIADLHLSEVGVFVAAFDLTMYMVQDQSVANAIRQKLLWWQLGGGISTWQRAVIIGIIQAQAPHLDAAAGALSIVPLAQRAFADAGVRFP
jgi:hypothetical protein